MRVRITGAGYGTGWANRDRDYLVLYLSCTSAGADITVLLEDGFYAIVALGSAEVTDDRIPPGWTVSASPRGVDLGPEEFHAVSFWSQMADERGPDDDGTWQQPTYRRVVISLVEAVGTDLDRAAVKAMPAWGENP